MENIFTPKIEEQENDLTSLNPISSDYVSQPFDFLIYSKILRDTLFPQIKNEIVEYSNNNQKGFIKNNKNSLFSDYSLPKDKFELLKSEIKLSSEEYFDSWSFPTSKLYLEEIWIDVVPPNSPLVFNRNTSQYDSNLFSGVLVVENSDKENIIELVNPFQSVFPIPPNYLPSKFLGNQEGNLIIFPSGTEYNIKENNSGNYKILINFNIIIDYK